MTDDLSGRLTYLLAGLAAGLQAQIRDAAGESYLPVEQWRVLGLLAARDGRAMSDLAVQSFVEPATLTKIVDRMVSDGLVYRAPDTSDRRRVLIFLAEQGRRRFKAFDEIVRAQEAAVLRRLTTGNSQAYLEMSRDLLRTDNGSPMPQQLGKSRLPVGESRIASG